MLKLQSISDKYSCLLMYNQYDQIFEWKVAQISPKVAPKAGTVGFSWKLWVKKPKKLHKHLGYF